MIHLQTWGKAWRLLEVDERRRALSVLLIVVIVGLFSATMVGSVFPFLAVLADRDAIARIPLLNAIYTQLGFTSEYHFVIALGFASLTVILVATAMQILRAFSIYMFCARQAESIGVRLLEKYLRQPYAFFLNEHSGNLQTRVLSVSYQIIDQFYRPAAEIIAAAISAVAILALIFWYAPLISLYCILALGSIYGLTYAATRRKIARHAKIFFDANQSRFRIASEAIGGFKAIKILGRERTYVDRFRKPAHQAAHAQIITGVTTEIPNYVLQALAFGGIIGLALVLAASGETDDHVDIGELLPILGLFAFAGQRLLPELQRIYAAFTQMQHGHIAVSTLYHDLIELEEGDRERVGGKERLDLIEYLEFDKVNFTYQNAERPGLQSLSVRIQAGERIGVVGTTGAGKSTFADILLGLIRPDSGTVSVDGTALTSENIRSWQKSLGYVPQDIYLIEGSITQNVAFGRVPDEIDHARVATACEIAQLSAFIETDLPDGLDTLVGERGVRLSGGQRQRIGIARALYSDITCLVLDEATSALDPVTEQEVMSGIKFLPAELTTIQIAHRLSTVAHCDRIFVFDRGALVAAGPWDELMRSSAVFRSLAAANSTEQSETA